MTIDLPSPVSPTIELPQYPNVNNPSFPVPAVPGFPASAQNGGVQLTVLQAISNSLLPSQIQIATYTPPGAAAISFTAQGNPTLNSLMQTGQIPSNALVSTLTFASPNANYGGT